MFGLQQKGLSPIGILFVVCVFVFFVMISLKLGPKYIDYNTIRTVFQDAVEEAERDDMKPKAIIKSIEKKLLINNIRDFKVRDSAFIGQEKGITFVEFEYEVREHLFYNIDVLLTFSFSEEF